MFFLQILFSTDTGLKIDNVQIKLDCKTFENGKINLMICGEETCSVLKGQIIFVLILTIIDCKLNQSC